MWEAWVAAAGISHAKDRFETSDARSNAEEDSGQSKESGGKEGQNRQRLLLDGLTRGSV